LAKRGEYRRSDGLAALVVFNEKLGSFVYYLLLFDSDFHFKSPIRIYLSVFGLFGPDICVYR
jgi:hypothetical protein